MRTKRRGETAAFVGVALCAFTAQAFALPPPPYAVVDLSYSMIGQDAAGMEEAGFEPLGSDRRDAGYAITIGWRFSQHLGVEGTFLELGEGKFNVAVPTNGSMSNAAVRLQSHGVLLSLAGTFPIHEKLSIEGRAGTFLGKTETRASGTVAGPFGNQTFSSMLGSDSKAGLAAGIGAVASFNDTWAVRAGYDYLDGAFGKDAGRISLGVRFNWP
jgi:opacity protein-like surface antigen